MLQVVTKFDRAQSKPKRVVLNPDKGNIRELVSTTPSNPNAIAEFVGTGDYNAAFFERQRYEIEAGRDEEPILYDALYDIVEDPNLPETLKIYRLNPTGAVLESVKEGEQVKFMTVTDSNITISQVKYAVGLEYTQRLFKYMGNLWQIPRLERSFGNGINARMNDIHLSPFISHSYASGYKVNGTTLTDQFLKTESIEVKYMRTIEQAISKARENNAYGPYGILCSTGDVWTIQRALNPVAQRNVDSQGSFFSQITNVIAYDGWSGTRGKKAESYSGVTDGKAYLISLNRMDDFMSLVSQPLLREKGLGDPTRFILPQDIWSIELGVYTNVAETTIEITLPAAGSGAT